MINVLDLINLIFSTTTQVNETNLLFRKNLSVYFAYDRNFTGKRKIKGEEVNLPQDKKYDEEDRSIISYWVSAVKSVFGIKSAKENVFKSIKQHPFGNKDNLNRNIYFYNFSIGSTDDPESLQSELLCPLSDINSISPSVYTSATCNIIHNRILDSGIKGFTGPTIFIDHTDENNHAVSFLQSFFKCHFLWYADCTYDPSCIYKSNQLLSSDVFNSFNTINSIKKVIERDAIYRKMEIISNLIYY